MHRSSRAGDPLLHTHMVVGNLTQGPDGRWTALDARHLYRQAKTAGYLYQAALRRELTERLGLEWEPVQRGVADVRGVPRGVVEHFSRRRAEILEHMADRGVHSAAAAQVAALETRRVKHVISFDRLRADWQARAEEHGVTPDLIAGLTGRVQMRQPERPDGLLTDVTEESSTFGRPELLQALAAAQPTGARVGDLERLARAELIAGEVVPLRAGTAVAGVRERRYSTREMISIEARLIDCAVARRDTGAGQVRENVLARLLADHPSLSDEQRAVVRDLCAGGDGVEVVRAAAGTGKTFVLDAARAAWQADRIAVVGCALSARAALELQDQSGIPADTIAAVRQHLDRGGRLPHHGVLVVDEAGMVGTRALAELADAAARDGTKLVLVGDDRQLPEIQAGGAFAALADRLGASHLTKVRRQRQPWDRAALDALRNGDVERWARAYRDAGHITIADRAPDTLVALVNDWSRADGERLMIAARRTDVRDLNNRARQLLRDRGELGPDIIQIGGRGFAAADRVLGVRNDRRLGILNGQRGTIVAIDPERELVTAGLERLLGRSHAKDLALDSLPDLDPSPLNAERARLSDHLNSEPPPSHDLQRLAHEAATARQSFEDTGAAIKRLETQRSNTSRLRPTERARLKELIAISRGTETGQRERSRAATEAHTRAARQTESWLQAHGANAARLLTVDEHLQETAQYDRRALRRVRDHDRSDTWLTHPERPFRRRDLTRDIGLGR